MTFVRIWVVFFLQGMGPGFWIPALTNVLKAEGLESWVTLAFLVIPLCTLISPLIGGALADQKIPANRLLVATSLSGAALLFLAFAALDANWDPWWFIGFLGLASIAAGPSWGLLTTITMTHLENGEKQFPLVRLGATLGWMAAGWLTSYVLNADNSPVVGYAAAAVRILGGICTLFLPLTLPLGVATSWRSRLGFDAFSLLKQQDHCVFFVVTALFSIPLAAFYMYAPELLEAQGDKHATATMTIAQISEVVAMLLVGSVMVRFRLKVLLMWALGFSVLRFGMSAYAGGSGLIGWHIGGIALHGVCYTFYFITAQVFLDRRVDPGMRGQAQGLLSLVSIGIGPLVGTLICSWLHKHYVRADGQGWMEFWTILAAMIAVCFIIFTMFYRGSRHNTEAAK